jgi:biopolymer transport protein ExbD
MRVRRTASASAEVPTSSMADISFLLLVFFMATTIFKMENGLAVQLPRAEMGVKVPRQRTAHIWVDRRGDMTIDDLLVRTPDIELIIAKKLSENSSLVVGLNIDRDVPYLVANDVMEQLKKANALNTSFTVDMRATP